MKKNVNDNFWKKLQTHFGNHHHCDAVSKFRKGLRSSWWRYILTDIIKSKIIYHGRGQSQRLNSRGYPRPERGQLEHNTLLVDLQPAIGRQLLQPDPEQKYSRHVSDMSGGQHGRRCRKNAQMFPYFLSGVSAQLSSIQDQSRSGSFLSSGVVQGAHFGRSLEF